MSCLPTSGLGRKQLAHSNGATEETMDYLEGLGKPTRDGEAPRHRVALLAGGGSHPPARPGGREGAGGEGPRLELGSWVEDAALAL